MAVVDAPEVRPSDPIEAAWLGYWQEGDERGQSPLKPPIGQLEDLIDELLSFTRADEDLHGRLMADRALAHLVTPDRPRLRESKNAADVHSVVRYEAAEAKDERLEKRIGGGRLG